MTLGEVVNKYPDALPIMLKYGLHCIGCHVASFETIEQGCKAHGMDDHQLKKMIDEINKTLKTKK